MPLAPAADPGRRQAAYRVVAHGEFCRAFAFGPFFWAIYAFGKSQRSVKFRERARWHTHWHFGLQLALFLLIFDACELAGDLRR